MNGLWTFGLVLTWIAILAGGWLGWQLIRQNGRLLLRLEGLEERVNEFEFGEDDDRADRFSNRSLTRSRLKRDGLKPARPRPISGWLVWMVAAS